MTDIVSPAKRKQMMKRIRSHNTQPEKAVRRWLYTHRIGFRLHYPGLPVRPDIIVPSRHIAIFVHGCFWHRHGGCKLAYNPKSNVEKWEAKFRENVERDHRAQSSLEHLNWTVITIWECAIRSGDYAAYLAEIFPDKANESR